MATEVTVVCNSAIGKEDKNYNGNAPCQFRADMSHLPIIGLEPIIVIQTK